MPTIEKTVHPKGSETMLDVVLTLKVTVPASSFYNEVTNMAAKNADEAVEAIQATADPEYDDDNAALERLYAFVDVNPDESEWTISIEDAVEETDD
jgi:hypothetical protein